MKKILSIALATLIVASLAGGALAADDIKIGVLAKRGADKCLAKWGATGEYLSAQLGQPVKIIPLKFDAVEPAAASGKIDFILANSAFYVQLEKKHGAKAVATLINSSKGQALDRFGGVIFVRADSDIQELPDLAGKKFMWVKKSSFGGAQMAWRHMLDKGFDPERDCASVTDGGKHDNVVMAVKNGAVDAGTVRSDTIERMVDEGKVAMSDFRILDQVADDFPFVPSTELYPEWPLAALPNTDPAVAGKVSAALMGMAADSPAAKAAKCRGWTEPADYGSVQECLRVVGMGI
jgi:two-component system sensor histidine kinase TtrS